MEDSQIVINAKEKLKYTINIYLGDLFSDMEEVVHFHQDALEKEDLLHVPEIDYMRLQRFIVTAVNNLKDRDPSIQSPLFVKLYKDINVLIKFYNLFIKRHNNNGSMHLEKFIKKSTAFAQILEEATGNAYANQVEGALRNTSTIVVEGAATRDEFIQYSEHTFLDMFDKRFKLDVKKMKDIINIKSHIFDKVFWSNARNSQSVKIYFNDMGVTGHFNLKTYIESYLKSVDVTKMKDADWHQYLQSCLKYLG